MKPLKPSHREKKRYLLVKTEKSAGVENIKEFRKQINLAVREFLGVLGMAKASMKFIDSGSSDFGTNSKNKEFWVILCVNKGSLEKVRAAFCLYSGFDSNPNENKKGIRVENVSGTLRKLRSEIPNNQM